MFVEHLRAGFPALWIETQEPGRTISEWAKAAMEIGFKVFRWDIIDGVRGVNGNFQKKADDPLQAIKFLEDFDGERVVLFLCNYHKFINAIEVSQKILNVADKFKSAGKVLVVLSPNTSIPIELEKVFVMLTYELPDREELKRVLLYMSESSGVKLPKNEVVENILEAGRGLSSFEFENSLALSLVTKNTFEAGVVMDQKCQLIKKNSTLILENYDESMANLGGLENLKEFCLKVASSPLSRGVLLLGTPGTGKSHFAKALGRELGLPTPALDFGRMFGSLVGESEGKIRAALKIIDAFSPCVLFIDEFEKGISGIQSSGQTDSGVGSKVYGTFLTWLSDHKSRVFVVATCNDISKIPPEFLRAERWDAIFFVDLPNGRERRTIFEIYRKHFGIREDFGAVNMDGWSGAEIKSVCRIAAMLKSSLQDAARYVMPLSQSMGEKINGLREWASMRTIPASLLENEGGGSANKRKLQTN